MKPNEPCATCAFGPAGAGKESDNALKGLICAMGGTAFRCHHAPDGFELNWRGSTADFLKSMRGRGDYRVCAGWKAEVARMQQNGRRFWFVSRALAGHALDNLALYISSEDPEEKAEAFREMKATVEILRKNRPRLRRFLRKSA